MSNHSFPPFGKILLQKRKAGKLPLEINLCVGNSAWNLEKHYKSRACLVLPSAEPPQNFNWSIVKDREVLVWLTSNIDYEQIQRLGYELLKSQAKVVRVLSMLSWDIIAIYRRGDGNARK